MTAAARARQAPRGWPLGLHLVPVEALAGNPLNPRRDVGDVSELAASIREHGVLQALVAYPDPADPGRLVMIAGHRRRAAAVRAGLAEVPVDVRPAPAADDRAAAAEQILAMLAENLQREGLSPVEEGDAYEQLRLLDYTPEAIAQGLGRRRATVERRLALSGLPEPLRERVHAGQVTIGDADALTEFAGDPDAVARLEAQLGTPNYRAAVEQERARLRLRAAVTRRIAEAEAAGIRVVRPEVEDWKWTPPADGTPAALGRLDLAGDVGPGQSVEQAHAASCPGHVLVVWAAGTQATTGCVEASRHGLYVDAARGNNPAPAPTRTARAGSEPDTAAQPDPDAAAVEAERARVLAAEERRLLGEELTAAAAARDDWIRQLLAPSTKPLRAQQTAMLRHALLHQLHWHMDATDELAGETGRMLGITPPDPAADRDGVEAWTQRTLAGIDRWPVERLVQAWWAVTFAGFSARLTEPGAWRSAPAAVRRFLTGLAELGYTPADVETRMLDQVAGPPEVGA